MKQIFNRTNPGIIHLQALYWLLGFTACGLMRKKSLFWTRLNKSKVSTVLTTADKDKGVSSQRCANGRGAAAAAT